MNELLEECLKVFGVKINPVIDWWFIPTEYDLDGSAEYPADFDRYEKYKTADVFGVNYTCYAKKAVNGCFSERYWKRG